MLSRATKKQTKKKKWKRISVIALWVGIFVGVHKQKGSGDMPDASKIEMDKPGKCPYAEWRFEKNGESCTG